jgi:2-keto-4-pentenoate hydratase
MPSAHMTPLLDQLTTEILQSRHPRKMLAPFTNVHPDFDLKSAYAVAHQIHQADVAAGAVPVGRKIGFTNRALWSVFNVHQPVWGYMYSHTVQFMQHNPSAPVSLSGLFAPKIEPEIVLHFAASPRSGDDLAAILACIDWIALGFEIVDSPFPDWKFKAPDCTATGALHAKLLVGEPLAVKDASNQLVEALSQFKIDLYGDGQLRDSGAGANVLGSPLAAIAHLQTVLQSQPAAAPIQAGDIITTGTLTQALNISAGQQWHTRIEGLALADIQAAFTH